MARAKFTLATVVGTLLTLATAAVALASTGIPWGP
jgi:hypothetical protein